VEAASPDLEKQGFFAVVFIYREYSGQQEDWFLETSIVLLLKKPLLAKPFITPTVRSVP
jgi:hypothetical protein